MTSRKSIRVRGARTHNLQDVDVDLPREAFTAVCGVSGSGKSSLVLDTLGAESRRRFLSTWTRMEATTRPDVDRIEGLPPAVAAGFTARAPGRRRTLGTVTEVTHALRALFARASTPRCPACGADVRAWTREEVTSTLLGLPPGTRLVLTAPRGRGPEALADAVRDGFVRLRLDDGAVRRAEEIDPSDVLDATRVEVVVDRLIVKAGQAERFAASVDQGLDLGSGLLRTLPAGEDAGFEEQAFADRPWCGTCDVLYPRLAPNLFSFDSASGACRVCEGLGNVLRPDPEKVLPRGLRLARAAVHVARYVPGITKQRAGQILDAAAARAGLEGRARVADLPEAERLRCLEGTSRVPGFLASVPELGAPEAIASPVPCPECEGRRLAPYPCSATLGARSLPDLECLTVDALRVWLESLALDGAEGALAEPARRDAVARLAFLEDVGLAYLTPGRAAASLSGGELRRARLAAACAARMSGLLFLLDEPTAGLHPADRPALRQRLRALVEEGNTVVCVEHDAAVLLEADHVVELGPGAGASGGRIVAEGSARDVLAAGEAPVARALRDTPPVPRSHARPRAGHIEVRGACVRNLRAVDADLPLRGFTCLTGVSGAGKSTLLLDVLAPAVQCRLDRAPFPSQRLARLDGAETIERLGVARGSAPRHPRATPGSVLGVEPALRRLFAATLDARTLGWAPSRFSRHVAGGRCEACKGLGEKRVALRDLAPLRVRCDECDGQGFARDTLRVRVKGLSIADVLDLPLEGAAALFRDIPTVQRPLAAATDVGLGYVRLGEPTSRMSGGEALRLRLAGALGRGGHAPTLYLLDEPSAGLHPADVIQLSKVLLGLAEAGHTVVAVEHHLRLIRVADHVVELGPGPAEAGGRIVHAGPPASLLEADTPTGHALREEERRVAAWSNS